MTAIWVLLLLGALVWLVLLWPGVWEHLEERRRRS